MRKQSNRVITPMSVIHKLFLICLCLFGPLAAWSQTGNTYVSRDAFYDSLEARAKALSQRLADISGTEPIPFERPPPTILSTRPPPPNPAQRAFDALPEQNPNPAASPLVPTVPGTDDGILYRADGTPVKIKEETPELPVKKGPPRKEMQRDRGQYFIQPFVGLGFISSDVSLSYVSTFGSGSPIRSNVDIETKIGHAIGVSLGRRWDNLEGELHFSYATVGYDSADVTSPSSTFSEIGLPASGEVELFQVGARVGYGLPVGESGWVRAAGGFGYGKRRDFLSIRPLTSASRNYSSSESAFTYDLLFSLGYEIEWGLDAFLAYRLLGSSGNGDFDKVAMHLFELGLGANF
jgi:hypothetical protein